MNEIERHWVYCPVCRGKTHEKIRADTMLENFPLFCPKCKRETLVSVKNLKVIVIKAPAA